MTLQYEGSCHNHSEYSNTISRDSINKLKDIMWYAANLGHSVFGLTDHECLSGHVKAEYIYNDIKKEYPDFKLIRGNEIYLCRNDLNSETHRQGEKYYHFILLAKDAIGHKQIRELSTRAWMHVYDKGRRRTPTYYSDLEEIIGANPGHVIGSTACRGSAIGTQIMNYRDLEYTSPLAAQSLHQEILNWCLYLQDIFGKDNFYLEFQPSADKEQKYINQKMIAISKELNIPYIVTCDAHYSSKDKRAIHSAYLKSQNDERETESFYATTYLMDTNELESYLNYLTREELDYAYQNIINIKNSCSDYTLLKPLKIPELTWITPSLVNIPDKYIKNIPYLHNFITSEYECDRVLVRTIVEKLESDSRLQNQETYNEVNINLESTWISSEVSKTRWSAYFLNLRGIINTCWEAGSIVLPGRGSGVGFILLYLLDITQINPLWETTTTKHWRFLNPERVSVLDVDFDISGLKRAQVLDAFRQKYGEDRVANVATFATEKSKAAILTAARGLEIDTDEAQYLASLIPSDRGETRTLKQCFYGDEENDWASIADFKRLMSTTYQELWKVAQEIEGLICRVGIHAGGVIFVDEPFTNSSALMRAPDGTIITQFELHDAESQSLIKYDALSVEAADRIQTTLELLQQAKLIDPKLSIKEAYEQTIGIYNLERTAPKMWEMVWSHQILSLFQMEQASGIQGIALTKPTSVDELATLNSVIRLMAPDKNSEQPLNKYARFKQDINLWYEEMRQYGLTQKEMQVLEPIVKNSYGICEAQEKFMQIVQLPECGGFSLTWADALRKAIAKKNPAGYYKLEEEYFRETAAKGCSVKLCEYVWRVLIAMSRGYGFNLSHTLAYSLVGLQEMNLAYRFPIIYWNCANLIVDSGGGEDIDDKGTDYGKMALALNKIIDADISVTTVNINKSDLSFEPDAENNQILFGMKALSAISNETVERIKVGRPYKSIKDFMQRCPLNKTQMISLIKAGAFDELDKDWAQAHNIEPRKWVMIYYLMNVCEPKDKLNLQNLNGLIQKGLLPSSLDHQRRVYEFNKYLKAYTKVGQYFVLDEDYCLNFYSHYYDIEHLEVINGHTCIKQKTWDKIYQKEMDEVRQYLKDNQKEMLNKYNEILFKETWNKYALGTISAWEMEAMCFYYHEHELNNIDTNKYGIDDFFKLPEEPEVDYYFKRKGQDIPVWKTHKIIGTVISKNDTKATITLLTTTGVVSVKFTKEYYAQYKKTVSEIGEDGKKHTVEKSWFKRGAMLMITGYRRGDQFVAKSYTKTLTHQIYKISLLNNGRDMELVHERADTEELNNE